MKRIFFFILLIVSFAADAQVKQQMGTYGIRSRRVQPDSAFRIPTVQVGIKDAYAGFDTAQIYYRKSDSSLLTYTGSQWILARGAAGGGASGLQAAITADPTLTTNNTVAGGGYNFTFGNHKNFTIDADSSVTVQAIAGSNQAYSLYEHSAAGSTQAVMTTNRGGYGNILSMQQTGQNNVYVELSNTVSNGHYQSLRMDSTGTYLKPISGNLFIDSLNYTLSSTGKKIPIRDTASGLVQNIDPATMVRPLISLTTTGSSGAATYSNVTGVLNVPQYSGGSGSSGPVTYVSGPSAITDTFSIVGSTYTPQGDYTWYGLLDDQYIMTDEKFNTNSTLNLVYGGTASDTRVSSGIFTQTGSTALDTTGIAWGFNAKAPFYGFSVPIISTAGGTVDKVMLAITNQPDITQTGRNMISVTWDATTTTNNVTIRRRKNNTDSLLQTVSFTVQPPFELGVSQNGQNFNVWSKALNQQWNSFVSFELDTTREFDMRDTASLSSFNKAAIYFIRQGNATGTTKIGGPNIGYTKGVAAANFSPVCYDDATPVVKGNDYLVFGSVAQITASFDEYNAIRTAGANVFSINPQTNRISTYQKIFTERGGKIFGENSGSVTYDSTRNKWIYLIPTWGSHTGIGSPTNIMKYETDDFKNGVIVLKDGTLVTGLAGTTQYDPDIKKIGSTWYMVYTEGYGAGTMRTATSNDLTTWAQQRNLVASVEGGKITRIGGGWKILGATISTGTQVVYDTSGTLLGTFSRPSNMSGGLTPSHPCILPVRIGPNTEYYWVFFDNKEFNTIDYTWGNVHILKANEDQVGHDFAIKNYSDIGNNESLVISPKITDNAILQRTNRDIVYNETSTLALGFNPSSVSGDINHRLNLYTSSSAAPPYGAYIFNQSTGGVGIQMRNSNILNTNRWQFFLDNSATPKFKIGQDNIGDYLTILSSSAYTGIGVTPLHQLQVNGDGKFGSANQVGAIIFGDVATTNAYVGAYRGTSSGARTAGDWLNLGAYDGINLFTGNAVFGSQTLRVSIPNSTGNLQVVNKQYIGSATTTPTALLHLAAGTSAVSKAPLKFTTGTSNTTAEAGAMEYTTPQLFFTNGGAIRQEIPQIQQSRVSTQYDETDETLGNITGLTANVAAGKTYRFEATLYTTSDVGGGIKVAIGGTATATAIIYEGLTTNAGLITQSRATALGTAVGAVTAVTAAYITITGTITVNAAGTLTVQSSRNAAVGTTSVLVGSTFVITEMN